MKSFLKFTQQLEGDDSQSKWPTFVWYSILIGVITIAIRSIPGGQIISNALILSGSTLFVGLAIGFLFGIPKTVVHKVDSSSEAPVSEVAYLPNTNLEDVSDWLSKMILGIGLVQLKQLPTFVGSIAEHWKDCFGPACPQPFAAGVIVYFFTVGFLFGYLWTRLALIGDFRNKDPRNQLRKLVEEVGRLTTADPSATDHSSNREVFTPVQANAARAIVSLSERSKLNITDLQRQIRSLSQEYETTRASMPAGDKRTRQLEVIASKMRTFSLAAYSLLPELTASDSAGDRLAAITFLQTTPDPKYFDWLADRLKSEQPFVGYHAALALLNAARSATPEMQDKLRTIIQRALNEVSHLGDSTDRVQTLRKALEVLNGSHSSANPTTPPAETN